MRPFVYRPRQSRSDRISFDVLRHDFHTFIGAQRSLVISPLPEQRSLGSADYDGCSQAAQFHKRSQAGICRVRLHQQMQVVGHEAVRKNVNAHSVVVRRISRRTVDTTAASSK